MITKNVKLKLWFLVAILIGTSFSSCEKETVYYVVENEVEYPKTENESGDDDDGDSISSPTGTINGYGYVDLGLSVKWAICNVGAYNPFGYGNYYAWGETKPKSEYTKDNCVTKDLYLGSIAGNATYDAARANWGGTWRMPTEDEILELQDDKCKWELVTIDGHYGSKVTGPNGNSIFLPAAGYYWDAGVLDYLESSGRYWTATPDYYTSSDYRAVAMGLGNGSSRPRTYTSRYQGFSVRAVSQ